MKYGIDWIKKNCNIFYGVNEVIREGVLLQSCVCLLLNIASEVHQYFFNQGEARARVIEDAVLSGSQSWPHAHPNIYAFKSCAVLLPEAHVLNEFCKFSKPRDLTEFPVILHNRLHYTSEKSAWKNLDWNRSYSSKVDIFHVYILPYYYDYKGLEKK